VNSRLTRFAVGLRVKSGWAVAVLLAGPSRAPRALDRRVIDLSDESVPESKQPYHAAMGRLEEDSAKIRQRTKVVQRVAARSLAVLLDEFRAAGYAVDKAGLVVGSQIDPRTISNPHIRAHALEGQLFRKVLEDELKTQGLSCSVVVERDAYTRAAEVLKRSEDDLKRTLSGLGRQLDGPWRAEEKLAALVAWMTLA
jgi:hypothetical protein